MRTRIGGTLLQAITAINSSQLYLEMLCLNEEYFRRVRVALYNQDFLQAERLGFCLIRLLHPQINIKRTQEPAELGMRDNYLEEIFILTFQKPVVSKPPVTEVPCAKDLLKGSYYLTHIRTQFPVKALGGTMTKVLIDLDLVCSHYLTISHRKRNLTQIIWKDGNPSRS